MPSSEPYTAATSIPLTDAQRAMVEANQGLVYYTVGRYLQNVSEQRRAEAEAAGMLGLIRAVQLYDETKARFSTYAVIRIRQAIQMDHNRLEGHGYRAAKRNGQDWEAPLSLDAPMTEGGDSLYSIIDTPGGHDTENEGTAGTRLAELLEEIHRACRDDIDRLAVAAIANGTPLSAAARAGGLSSSILAMRLCGLRIALGTGTPSDYRRTQRRVGR